MKTPRHITPILTAILWLLSGYVSIAAAQATLPPTIAPTILNAPPLPGDDSLRARIKACLSMGDMACIVTQWVTLKGIERAPDWLTKFQKAFEPTNRQAGKCVQVARSIHEGLSKLGERPDFLRITLVGEHRKILGFDEFINGVFVKNYQVSTNGYHVAVRLNGKVIDAYTGLIGLPEEEYIQRLVPYPGMKLLTEVVESL